jgi:hypothetical protein
MKTQYPDDNPNASAPPQSNYTISNDNIYPKLDAPPQPNYAIIIQDIRNELLKEKEMGEKNFKNYKKLMNRFHNVEMAMSTATVALGASGIGVLAGVATIPIGLGLEAASGVCGLLGVLFNRLQKKYERKSRKNDEIRILAASKLDLILGMYTKMMSNGVISDEEYVTLRKEMDSFREIKKSICNTKINEN